MKKPITIGVIAVIATILVTSAVDYSAIGAKPIDQFHLEVTNVSDGILSCPNGDSRETFGGFIRFTEYHIEDRKGDFAPIVISPNNQEQFRADLWSGNIDSNKFMLTGIGFANSDLAKFCDEASFDRMVITVWGDCGREVTTHFETDLGYSGSFTGNALCV